MMRPYQVKDANGRVSRVNAATPEEAMQIIANRHGVPVVAWRESRAAEDAIHVGIPRGASF